MLNVHYHAAKFGHHWGHLLSGSHSLSISWNELVWAAITMGKPGVAFLLTHGWHSISDWIVRSHTVYAHLQDVHGDVHKSSLYKELDPTEKCGVSYFIGMLAAKVLSARLLDVPWLFHVSMIGAIGGSVTLKSKSQPDLIGLRRNRDWVVAEAKGRTLGFSPKAMTGAKLQTRQLRQINGSLPALRVAVQAFFAPNLQWTIEDPDEFDSEATDMSFDAETALEGYYSAAVDATSQGAFTREIAGRSFLARKIPEVGVTVAIDQDLRQRVVGRLLAQSAPRIDGSETGTPRQSNDFVVFADGLAVALDERWSEDRMRRDPRARRG
jgi:hypothetical protein